MASLFSLGSGPSVTETSPIRTNTQGNSDMSLPNAVRTLLDKNSVARASLRRRLLGEAIARTKSISSSSERSRPADWSCVEVCVSSTHIDETIDLLWTLDTLGLQQVESGERVQITAFFSSQLSPRSLKQAIKEEAVARGLDIYRLRVRRYRCNPDDWVHNCRENFSGFAVGNSFYVHPSWERPPEGVPAPLQLEPGHAFGTGTHESTQLCLLALEREAPRTGSLLDVGTGSGILSIAARKLNSDLRLVSLDIDALACQMALENFRRNQVEDVHLVSGPLACLRSRFELVVANLTLEIIRSEAAEILAHASGKIVLSGFTQEQGPLVLEALTGCAPVVLERRWVRNGWQCFLLSPLQDDSGTD